MSVMRKKMSNQNNAKELKVSSEQHIHVDMFSTHHTSTFRIFIA